MLEDLQIRRCSPNTIRIYLRWIAEFAQHFGKSPDRLSSEHIRQYQLFLIKEKKVSRPTFHPDGLRAAVPVRPHAEPENLDGTHSLPTPGKETAADLEPRGSEGAVGSAGQSSPSHPADDPVRLWTPGLGSDPEGCVATFEGDVLVG